MSEYIKITSNQYTKNNGGLKKALICIGKYYSKLNKDKVYTDEIYLECGIKYVARRCGHRKRPIRLMIEQLITKKPKEKIMQWCFHKRFYEKAYRYIIRLINKLLIKVRKKSFSNDKLYITKLLNIFYQDVCMGINENNELEHVYSNSLILCQKNYLDFYRIDRRSQEKEKARDILDSIVELDKKYHLPSDKLTIEIRGYQI